MCRVRLSLSISLQECTALRSNLSSSPTSVHKYLFRCQLFVHSKTFLPSRRCTMRPAWFSMGILIGLKTEEGGCHCRTPIHLTPSPRHTVSYRRSSLRTVCSVSLSGKSDFEHALIHFNSLDAQLENAAYIKLSHQSVADMSYSDRIKDLFKKYGRVGVGVHLAIYAATISGRREASLPQKIYTVKHLGDVKWW